jgi:alpha-glucosidase
MKSIFKTLIGFAIAPLAINAAISGTTNETKPAITILNPPELEFFSKQLSFGGIPIKAHKVVSDEALYAAFDRVSMMLSNQPVVVSNLVAAKVELHIIGKDQVTTDLPEWREDKGKPLPEYNGLTRDQRTRGMGGLLTSCGEENLLKLEKDKYHGRDIFVHEFAHAIRNFGINQEVESKFDEQYRRSLSKKLWIKSYAATNPDEFFAELTMWYFGTHGDLGMTGPKPENGPDGLKKYDPDAFALMDAFYGGRIQVSKVDEQKQ